MENRALHAGFDSALEQVHNIARSLETVSAMSSFLSSKIQEQSLVIDRLYVDALKATDDARHANEQLQQAVERSADFRCEAFVLNICV